MAYCLCNVPLPHKQNTIVFCFVVATRPVVAYHIGTLHPSFGRVRQPSKNITNSPPPCTLCIAEQNAASQVFFLVSGVLAHPHEAAHPAVDRADIWKGYTGVSLLWKLYTRSNETTAMCLASDRSSGSIVEPVDLSVMNTYSQKGIVYRAETKPYPTPYLVRKTS